MLGNQGKVSSLFARTLKVEFPTYEYLLSQPSIFPTVAPFKGYSPHSALVSPTDTWQADLFDIPPLHVQTTISL
jgi:hypothetical protein